LYLLQAVRGGDGATGSNVFEQIQARPALVAIDGPYPVERTAAHTRLTQFFAARDAQAGARFVDRLTTRAHAIRVRERRSTVRAREGSIAVVLEWRPTALSALERLQYLAHRITSE
jgi:hypothetical protein